MRRTDDPFTCLLPSLDIHGETMISGVIKVKDFISDNIILHNKKIIIIHGKGYGILRQAVRDYLKTDKRVASIKLDYFNSGITVVELI
ncbi:MAG: Smr/MutS family protein [Bacilli bacterium]